MLCICTYVYELCICYVEMDVSYLLAKEIITPDYCI